MRNMVKIMNNFGELLKKDSQISHEYEDEALVSSLRCTSMSFKELGFSGCIKDDFPIPGKPDFKKEKGTGKVRNYTLFTSRDFIELMSKDFFTDWDWGDYSEFFL